MTLPTYPFDRERYWAAPVPRSGQRAADGAAAAPVEEARESEGLFYKIAWEPVASARPRLRAPTALAEEAVELFDQLAVRHDFAIYDRTRPEFDRLTVDFICKALIELGFDATPGRRFAVRAEASQLRIAQRHARLFPELIALLARHGVLVHDGADYVVASMPTGDPVERSTELLNRFREVGAELEILRRCGARTLARAHGRPGSAEVAVR